VRWQLWFLRYDSAAVCGAAGRKIILRDGNHLMNPAHRLDWQLSAIWIASTALLIGCGGGGSPATPSYTISGTVAGLAAGTSIVLTNNSADSITVSGSSSFTFAKAIAAGSSYDVTIGTQPTGQTCTVSAGSGMVSAGNVTNVSIVCAPTKYTIGGQVTGLQPGRSVTLLDNGGDAVPVSANGTFTFPTGLTNGSSYDVTTGTQPADQNCFVVANSGTVGASNVTNVHVECPYVQTLYNFGLAIEGFGLEVGVLFGHDGNLYGVATEGGPNVTGTINALGAGSFFKVTLTGEETDLWNFGSGTDGQDPSGDLVMDASGNFYGTTYVGGLNGAGIIFKITATGQETVLWNFGSGNDGQKPFGSVVLGQDGNLYGTTSEGGANGGGTVFKLTTAGVETVLWDFGAGSDGKTPKGRLLQASDGNFYGTTESGGDFTYGSVFKLTPSGTETVLYSFAFGTDGASPEGLTQGPDGDFYGITLGGGAYSGGTAFKITPSGVETQLWSFGNDGDGQNPDVPPLLSSDGNFYGVTAGGGTSGLGTLYRLTPDGNETVLWKFKESEGSIPFSTLTQGPDGTIYGTTYRGGTAGGGVIFKLTM
jgi:uncharacterized repeat protein (TIGR03803 family)